MFDLLQAEARVHLQRGVHLQQSLQTLEVNGLPLLRQSSRQLRVQVADAKVLALRAGRGSVLLRRKPENVARRKTGVRRA